MKKRALLIAMILLALCAHALGAGTVRTTGSVNLREGPGRNYPKAAAVGKGKVLDYLGETVADARGVDWYKIAYKDQVLWVSSRYSKLEQQAPAEPAATLPPRIAPAVLPTLGAGDMVELSDFYLSSLSDAALALRLTAHGEDNLSELQHFYTNDALLIAGNDLLEHFLVTGPGYAIFGVYVGMDINAARSALLSAGLVQAGNTMGAYFQHLAGPRSSVNVDGYDSGISLMTDAAGTVTEISWSTYSG